MKIDPDRPVANGVHFDDAQKLSADIREAATVSGMVFLTEFKAGGSTYGGSIVALSMSAAEDIAIRRGLGERVIGTLEKTENYDVRPSDRSSLPRVWEKETPDNRQPPDLRSDTPPAGMPRLLVPLHDPGDHRPDEFSEASGSKKMH